MVGARMACRGVLVSVIRGPIVVMRCIMRGCGLLCVMGAVRSAIGISCAHLRTHALHRRRQAAQQQGHDGQHHTQPVATGSFRHRTTSRYMRYWTSFVPDGRKRVSGQCYRRLMPPKLPSRTSKIQNRKSRMGHRRQNAGVNTMSTVIISRRPAIIRKERIHLLRAGRWA